MPKYILFDTETTGAATEDRIIQVGAMVVEHGKEIIVYNSLCKPSVPIKIEAMEVHNIVPSMVENVDVFINTPFNQFLNMNNNDDNYLIAHNITFDLGMLIKEGFVNNYKLIDTLRISRHILDRTQNRLQYLRYALELYKKEDKEAADLGVEIKAHDAIGDVLVMKLLLSELTKVVKTKFPNENPMEKMVQLTKTPVMVKAFKFGKYKGSEVASIVKSDSGYLTWMLNNMENLDEDMTYTLEHYLGQ